MVFQNKVVKNPIPDPVVTFFATKTYEHGCWFQHLDSTLASTFKTTWVSRGVGSNTEALRWFRQGGFKGRVVLNALADYRREGSLRRGFE